MGDDSNLCYGVMVAVNSTAHVQNIIVDKGSVESSWNGTLTTLLTSRTHVNCISRGKLLRKLVGTLIAYFVPDLDFLKWSSYAARFRSGNILAAINLLNAQQKY
ncbi:hypothetical protein CVT26_015805 [Gymnopilus dilepis]|uniref:Uncharacterized protein n=1 Tax=Gymnopilus dilepis TaxID=231916 RepID=A0A409WXF4_9AGAR|nr:hypothetical protein CVT26_015805 [Gymnopilus dilepis]